MPLWVLASRTTTPPSYRTRQHRTVVGDLSIENVQRAFMALYSRIGLCAVLGRAVDDGTARPAGGRHLVAADGAGAGLHSITRTARGPDNLAAISRHDLSALTTCGVCVAPRAVAGPVSCRDLRPPSGSRLGRDSRVTVAGGRVPW